MLIVVVIDFNKIITINNNILILFHLIIKQ